MSSLIPVRILPIRITRYSLRLSPTDPVGIEAYEDPEGEFIRYVDAYAQDAQLPRREMPVRSVEDYQRDGSQHFDGSPIVRHIDCADPFVQECEYHNPDDPSRGPEPR